MKILHTSDWHLGRTLDGISRIDEQRRFIDELCGIADREDVRLVLVAGDIYDTCNPSAAAEELFYEAMDRLVSGGGRVVVAVAGNHDSPERLCASAPIAGRNGIILLGYPGSDAGAYPCGGAAGIAGSGPGWLELGISGCECNAVIIAMPYPSEARLDEVLSQEADEAVLQKAYSERIGAILERLGGKFRDDTVNLVIGHVFMRGGKSSDSERTLSVGGAMTVDPAVLPYKAHFAALGHLHRPQRVSDAPCIAYYSGSPIAYSFSESEYSKSVCLVDAGPGSGTMLTEVPLGCGRQLRRWRASEGVGQALEWCRQGRDAGAWIDLEIHTDRIITADEQKELKELNPGIVNIRPVLASDASDDGSPAAVPEDRETRSLDELFCNFYKSKVGIEASEELVDIFLEIAQGRDETPAGVIPGGSRDEKV